jgi:hypothetical protein
MTLQSMKSSPSYKPWDITLIPNHMHISLLKEYFMVS